MRISLCRLVFDASTISQNLRPRWVKVGTWPFVVVVVVVVKVVVAVKVVVVVVVMAAAVMVGVAILILFAPGWGATLGSSRRIQN